MQYDNGEFWSSKACDSADTDEFLVFKLKSKSFVFSVHFKAYRALYQGGVLYPSKTVKIHIGNSFHNFHYTSDEFDFPRSENYNTILILPNFVQGEYVKIELIGKVMTEPQTEMFYTVLSFVDIIGYPVDKEVDEDNDIENIIKTKDFKKINSNRYFKRTPFLYERIENQGFLVDFLKNLEVYSKEIENYLALVNKDNIGKVFNVRESEICANYFFEKGDYETAKNYYIASRDYWGLCKPLIRLELYNMLKDFVRYNDPRIPGLHEIYQIAKKLGPEYEKIVIEKLST